MSSESLMSLASKFLRVITIVVSNSVNFLLNSLLWRQSITICRHLAVESTFLYSIHPDRFYGHIEIIFLSCHFGADCICMQHQCDAWYIDISLCHQSCVFIFRLQTIDLFLDLACHIASVASSWFIVFNELYTYLVSVSSL